MFIGIDDYGSKSQVAIFKRRFAQINRNNLILVSAGAVEIRLVRVQLISHCGRWSNRKGQSWQGTVRAKVAG